MVCCSTDPSVPPDSSVYNISTTKGTEVNVSLQGLTSGQMYYCKAAATNTNSTRCAGPVVGGVKIYFSSIPSTKCRCKAIQYPSTMLKISQYEYDIFFIKKLMMSENIVSCSVCHCEQGCNEANIFQTYLVIVDIVVCC